ncbi:outer membrane lipoprotein carrier protein LolA [Streptomyces sp. NPDC091292]|uniref:LolA family protein n=1 Tax=Streptomyces sp. NPDC091292 TaxID=3365991 RepID=UPI00382B4F46
MAPYESGKTSDEGAAEAADLRAARRRKAARYVVPVTVMGVAAATIGLVPALATSGDPDLPKISAQQLIEKIAKSDTQQFSGTVKISTDLGLPDVGGALSSFAPGGKGGEGATADPQAKLAELATGTHTLRVAGDGPDRQKLSILDNAAEYSLIHNGDQVWAYDSKSNSVYHAKDTGATERGAKGDKSDKANETDKALPKDLPSTPKEFADEVLKASADTTSVTVDGTAKVAGRDAYKLLIKPKQSGSTVGAITIAVDAQNGTPLKFTLTPASGGSAVIDAGFTSVDFSKPAASTFDFTPPKGAKVTESGDLKDGHKADGSLKDQGKPSAGEGLNSTDVLGEGWSSIAVISTPGGQGIPSGGEAGGSPDAQKFLDSLGDQVSGKFGKGTVFSTRLINALVTDDGKVYVGAVTKDALVKAADAAH